jgi:Chitobiase/beta-hexosaminidase C-terminal domain
LPIGTSLTPDQATAMQRLAWDVVKNYPDCGLFEEGTRPVASPTFKPAAAAVDGITPVTLSSTTPGAWFRYTLDGTTPTRTRGYVYCGVVSARPGMTVKAIAFKSGMADSKVAEAEYAEGKGK